MKNSIIIILVLFNPFFATSQVKKADLHKPADWHVINRTTEAMTENGRKEIRFSEADNDGLMILKDYQFSNGTIEFDVKGKNEPQRSFVGLAFHIDDKAAYEVVYFRPFNFTNADTLRRYRSVQYVYMPSYSWDKLRAEFPGKFENKIAPVPDPDDWFHVAIQVEGKNVKVFVNRASRPCLEVTRLADTKSGGIALWTGNGSGASFANVVITPAADKKAIQYGNNPDAGRYADAGDARLYYEVYGKGKPLVLLHGGVYGYINEFEPFIPKLAAQYQVICIGTRGHGKSAIGSEPFTWRQRAADAYKVIRSITKDSVIVLGFSDGAYSGLKLAALYPGTVKKLIAIGAGDRPKGSRKELANYSPEMLKEQAGTYFESLLALMPEPDRWGECLSKINKLYNEDFISQETFEKIQCPVLVISGDRDNYHQVEDVVRVSKMIRNSQLAIIPGCHHVVFFCNFAAVWESVVPFLGGS